MLETYTLTQVLIWSLLVTAIFSISILTIKLTKLFNRKKIEIEYELLARVVGISVSAVQRDYPELDESSKYSKVYSMVTEKINLWGCSISPEEVEQVITATLNVFSKEKDDNS